MSIGVHLLVPLGAVTVSIHIAAASVAVAEVGVAALLLGAALQAPLAPGPPLAAIHTLAVHRVLTVDCLTTGIIIKAFSQRSIHQHWLECPHGWVTASVVLARLQLAALIVAASQIFCQLAIGKPADRQGGILACVFRTLQRLAAGRMVTTPDGRLLPVLPLAAGLTCEVHAVAFFTAFRVSTSQTTGVCLVLPAATRAGAAIQLGALLFFAAVFRGAPTPGTSISVVNHQGVLRLRRASEMPAVRGLTALFRRAPPEPGPVLGLHVRAFADIGLAPNWMTTTILRMTLQLREVWLRRPNGATAAVHLWRLAAQDDFAALHP
mmetsp:Transcript_102695/g.244810  ORF Transcript_102695/g.244810 Transcript_102695/m.244810 type:complete len:322 (+) Transcript_102695:284-1249(+)